MSMLMIFGCSQVRHTRIEFTPLHNSAGTKTPAPSDEAGVVDALLRYHYYIELGIDPQHVAPYNDQWLVNALKMVPSEPPPNVGEVSGWFDEHAVSRLHPIVAAVQDTSFGTSVCHVQTRSVYLVHAFLTAVAGSL